MPTKKQILLIAHTPSPNTVKMVNAVIKGASNPDLESTTLKFLGPLETQPQDIINAQAIILGTTENLGYMSGLMKDMFDRCYYECLEKTQGMPFTFYIRAGHDGTGTKRAIETITTGLRWKIIQQPIICKGEFKLEFLEQCEELGLSIAAGLDLGII